jgi:hypothetical protein
MAAERPCAPRCLIADPEHGGDCGPRTEHERAVALHALLDAHVTDDELAPAMEAGARASWGSS